MGHHILTKSFEKPKSCPPSTLKIIKKISVIKSEILIKLKRIKRTPSCKASLLLPGGKTKYPLGPFGELFQQKFSSRVFLNIVGETLQLLRNIKQICCSHVYHIHQYLKYIRYYFRET